MYVELRRVGTVDVAPRCVKRNTESAWPIYLDIPVCEYSYRLENVTRLQIIIQCSVAENMGDIVARAYGRDIRAGHHL